MRRARYSLGLLTLIAVVSFLGVWAGFVMTCIWSNTEIKVVYKESEPIYVTVDKVIEKDVYRQETPVIPVKKTGKEIILLDKSGSMKEFVTELYTSNVNFFTKNDVWAFDTEVSKDVTVDEIQFGGNTNLTHAVNMAVQQGYDTIWLCSDLEHNTGDFEFTDGVKGINIIVYAPKPLDEDKTQQIIEGLKEQQSHVKIITMS